MATVVGNDPMTFQSHQALAKRKGNDANKRVYAAGYSSSVFKKYKGQESGCVRAPGSAAALPMKINSKAGSKTPRQAAGPTSYN